MTTKQCKKCLETKTLTEFHKNKRQKYGHANICKNCRSQIQASGYKANWFHQTCTLKQSYCKKHSLPFNLDREYLESIWTDECPVLGKPFVRHQKGHDFCPSLDRVDPSKGYVKGNVKYISARANRIKYDASAEELKQVLAYVEGATTIPKGSTLK